MNIEEILALYDHDERRNPVTPGFSTERDGPVVRQVMEVEKEGLSFVIYSALDEHNANKHIERQIAYFTDLGRGFEWPVFAHDRPSDLAQRLAAKGFTAEDEEDLMVLELAQAPPRLLAPVTADLRRVVTVEGLETVRQLLTTIWEDEFAWFIPRMSHYLAHDDGYMSMYLALVNDQPASAAWIFMPQESRFASLYGGSTLPQYRRQGLYTALVATRVQEAIRRGYQFLTIDAGDMSRPIVKKHGFRLMTRLIPHMMKGK